VSSLEDRAVLALRGTDAGQAFVTFEELQTISLTALRDFLEALEHEAARRGLVVETAIVDNLVKPGVKFRWRPL
jgi:hypothetical protein